MTILNFVNSELGGVGKSTFTSMLYEYYIKKNKAIRLIDTDRSNPNVGIKYLPKDYEIGPSIFFSDHEDEYAIADRLFEKAVEERTEMLVNMPAQVGSIFDNWVERNQLFAMAAEHNVKFINWYLTNGSYHSIRLFKNFVEKYQDKMIHVLVKNGGLCKTWSHLGTDVDLTNLIDRYKVEQMELPGLETKIMYALDLNKLTFSEGLKSSSIKMMEKQRIKLFLERTDLAIENQLKSLDKKLTLEKLADAEKSSPENPASAEKQLNLPSNNQQVEDNANTNSKQVAFALNDRSTDETNANPSNTNNGNGSNNLSSTEHSLSNSSNGSANGANAQINSQSNGHAANSSLPEHSLSNSSNGSANGANAQIDTQSNGHAANSSSTESKSNNSSNGSANGQQASIDRTNQFTEQPAPVQTSESAEVSSNSESAEEIDPNHVFDPNDLEDDNDDNSSEHGHKTEDSNNSSEVTAELVEPHF